MPIVLLLQMVGEWDRWEWLIFISVWVGGTGVCVSPYKFCFFLVLLYFVLLYSQSHYLGG